MAIPALSIQAGTEPEEEEVIGEFQVAEYIIYLLSLDTYMRYAKEKVGDEEAEDAIIRKGLKILRMADQDLEGLKSFVAEHLPTPAQKKMLDRAVSIRSFSPDGAARRALQFRTLLSRGGATTMNGLFKGRKYVQQVREAISASMLDDADKALDILAALPMRNVRMRDWIDLAAKQAGSGEFAPSAVDAGSKESDRTEDMVVQGIQQLGATGAEESQMAQESRSAMLDQVERDAREAAKRSMDVNQIEDVPPTRSETVGLAVAAAAAALSDPSRLQNIPEPLRELDDEQRAAALTDGRVLVAASAGTGKSTTLVARTTYLVKDRGVYPSRILATSFNSKAAAELKGKVAAKLGDANANQMSGGGKSWTMHSIFKKQIMAYGNAEERQAMSGDPQKVGAIVATTVQRIWGECYDEKTRPTPSRKEMEKLKTQWSGNGVTPAEAKKIAKGRSEDNAADWYTMYEGLKGSVPGWEPPCEDLQKEVAEEEYQKKLDKWRRDGQRGRMPQRKGTTFQSFMNKMRPKGERLGDFDDMLTMFRDILNRNPGVKSTIQKTYDHVMVDECQDLNQVQFDIIMGITEHIAPDGKNSLWMVGDDKQSIYEFRGARPELFRSLAKEEDWKVRTIQTNYRCEPEIVDAANRLISHNTNQIEMQTLPSPHKPRGVGSVVVTVPATATEAALGVVEQIKQDAQAFEEGEERNLFYGDNAVLCRTNSELNAYEASCIIRGVPYSKKGAASFFNSPETRTVLGYVQLVTGDDNERMQKALGAVINKPNRFFLSDDAAIAAVDEAIRDYAKQAKLRINEVNPTEALREHGFRKILVQKLVPTARVGDFRFDKSVEDVAEMSYRIDEMQANSSMDGFKTTDLFDSILALKGKQSKVNPKTGRTEWIESTIRDAITASKRDAAGSDADEDEEGSDVSQLGNVAFLYELAKRDPTDPGDVEHDPSTPSGFRAKMSRFAARARVLNVEMIKDEEERKKKERQAIYIGTIHSVKGDQWGSTYVQMPAGKFPLVPRPKPGEPPMSEEDMEKQMESERRLGYVALTRAKKNLIVVCPKEVGGMLAGVSPFVHEADLKQGENVIRPGVAEQPDTQLPKQAMEYS